MAESSILRLSSLFPFLALQQLKSFEQTLVEEMQDHLWLWFPLVIKCPIGVLSAVRTRVSSQALIPLVGSIFLNETLIYCQLDAESSLAVHKKTTQ
ncbi:hypothetical protein Tco_0189162 [Tanacetum coccineum]